MPLTADIQKLELPELVELYTLDSTALGGGIDRWHPHTTEGAGDLVFDGNTYIAYPTELTGADRTTKGQLPRPTLAAANIGGALVAGMRQFGDFIGAKVTRIRTFSKYLDGAPDADPTQHFPEEIWYVDRKAAETKTQVVWELSAGFDGENKRIPARQMRANSCTWQYRGPECSFSGVPVTDALGNLFGTTIDRGAWDVTTTDYVAGNAVYALVNGVRVYYVASTTVTTGTPLTDRTKWTKDACLKKLSDCKAHFGADTPLPFGGFPGVNRLQRV